jgi:GNAT superfamily N-acetyltransferase
MTDELPRSIRIISDTFGSAVRPANNLQMVKLRSPNAEDCDDLGELLTQLGYPCKPSDIPSRVAKFADNADVLLTVAEHQKRVVGVVTGHVIHAIHKSEPVAMLTALVVLERARGTGIGRLLVAHVEQWARSHGARAISLTSALRRTGAHEFYRKLGYEHTGVRLAKSLV